VQLLLDELNGGLVVSIVLGAMRSPLGDKLPEIDRCGERGVARVVQLIAPLEIRQRTKGKRERGRER
jgi:hypothetical protein